MAILIKKHSKVGFTGARQGMTEYQKNTVKNLLMAGQPTEFHHGDCVGADADAHVLAVRAGIKTVGHPPDISDNRAFCGVNILRETKPYLDRNHDIVDETDLLIACPMRAEEVRRSGTWATVRYARKLGRMILIVYPSGRMFVEWSREQQREKRLHSYS